GVRTLRPSERRDRLEGNGEIRFELRCRPDERGEELDRFPGRVPDEAEGEHRIRAHGRARVHDRFPQERHGPRIPDAARGERRPATALRVRITERALEGGRDELPPVLEPEQLGDGENGGVIERWERRYRTRLRARRRGGRRPRRCAGGNGHDQRPADKAEELTAMTRAHGGIAPGSQRAACAWNPNGREPPASCSPSRGGPAVPARRARVRIRT